MAPNPNSQPTPNSTPYKNQGVQLAKPPTQTTNMDQHPGSQNVDKQVTIKTQYLSTWCTQNHVLQEKNKKATDCTRLWQNPHIPYTPPSHRVRTWPTCQRFYIRRASELMEQEVRSWKAKKQIGSRRETDIIHGCVSKWGGGGFLDGSKQGNQKEAPISSHLFFEKHLKTMKKALTACLSAKQRVTSSAP